MTTKGKGPLAAVCNLLERLSSLRAFDAKRLAAIEDRMARLDGGSDSTTAKHEAFYAANLDLIALGRPPLNFVIDGEGRARFSGGDER